MDSGDDTTEIKLAAADIVAAIMRDTGGFSLETLFALNCLNEIAGLPDNTGVVAVEDWDDSGEPRFFGAQSAAISGNPAVALEGRMLWPASADEQAILDVLAQERGRGSLSALGLTRWIRRSPEAAKPDEAIAAAAEKLWAGTLICKDQHGNYFVS